MTGYIKLSNGFWRSVKGQKLSRFNRAAGYLYILCLSYCGDELTDGKIPADVLEVLLGGTAEEIDYLVANKMLDKTDDGDYCVHDYLDWQRSRKDVETANRKSTERVRRWRARQKASLEDDSKTEKRNADVTALHSNVTAAKRSCNASVTDKPRTQNPEPKKKDISIEISKESITDALHSRSIRLPVDWQPTPQHQKKAQALNVDYTRETEKFRNWAIAKGAKYVNWDKAFSNWLIKTSEYKPRKPLTRVEQQKAEEAEMMRQLHALDALEATKKDDFYALV